MLTVPEAARPVGRNPETIQPRGNRAPDAHLVALMREHGVSAIWSHDRDFRKFRGITVRDPFSEKDPKGFE